MTESGQQILKSRVILFRSGGLGDILLTFPLLEILANKFDELIVSTPSKYHFLIREFSSIPNLFDLDEGDGQVIKLATVRKWFPFGTTPNGLGNGNLQVPQKLDLLTQDQLKVDISRGLYLNILPLHLKERNSTEPG